MNPDEVLAAFAALPHTTQMRAAAPVLTKATKRSHPHEGQRIEFWSDQDLLQFADQWDAEDAAEADREHLVEELGQALFEFWAPGFDREGTQGKQEFYRDRIRALLKRFDITPKEKP